MPQQSKQTSPARMLLLALLALLLLLFAAACEIDVVSLEYGGVQTEDSFGRPAVSEPPPPAWSMPIWERPPEEEEESGKVADDGGNGPPPEADKPDDS